MIISSHAGFPDVTTRAKQIAANASIRSSMSKRCGIRLLRISASGGRTQSRFRRFASGILRTNIRMFRCVFATLRFRIQHRETAECRKHKLHSMHWT